LESDFISDFVMVVVFVYLRIINMC